MPKTHDATFYVQIQRKDSAQYRNGKYTTASAIRITQESPTLTPKNTVTVKLTVQLPDGAFDPVAPSATIVIPSSLIQQPVHVIAEDPS